MHFLSHTRDTVLLIKIKWEHVCGENNIIKNTPVNQRREIISAGEHVGTGRVQVRLAVDSAFSKSDSDSGGKDSRGSSGSNSCK